MEATLEEDMEAVTTATLSPVVTVITISVVVMEEQEV